ncbi:MAG: PD40 domain-containing protein [Ardenticatenaceae bacterium]|nr:PD40 domain-containing protein [Ardenticatenaceae bacterium]MCB9446439.1 PD40 domain-containing protein [Ardenticatenaceae bacterium]
MSRQRIFWFAVSVLILSSLACNAFAGDTEPGLTLPPPPISETAAALPPTVVIDIAPTATLPGAATDVPLVDASGNPLLEALVDVNVRTGPGVQYNRDSFLFGGEVAQVLGRDPESGWWKIECPGRSSGTSCWVSGGSQYTKVTNGAGVPVAAVPPTPTPIPSPTPEIDAPDTGTSIAVNGLLTYADEDGLWLVTLDMRQNPPAGGTPMQLVEGGRLERPLLSPDGRKIAYIASGDGANSLHIYNLDNGSDRMLVDAAELPVTLDADTAVLVGQVEWLNNSLGLVFNTYFLNLAGPGAGERVDLWTVGLDGTVTERFEAGQGGGAFALSAGNQVILAQPDAIVRANLDGTGAETIIEFDLINTASEYIYYPQPQWAADGSAYVAIPDADPWRSDSEAALWRIPTSGKAEGMAALPGNILFDPVQWSPDGSRLAYVQRLMDPSNPPPVLILADGNGRNVAPYASNTQLAFFGWSPNGQYFLYAASDHVGIGQVDVPPKKVEITGGGAQLQWLNASAFIAATAVSSGWNLTSVNLGGETVLLATANATPPQFDVWSP